MKLYLCLLPMYQGCGQNNLCLYICVGSRFVADRNSVGFARKTALTISFVERGFERLGLDR